MNRGGGRPLFLAVCGRPVAHSLSPSLFAAAFRALGLPHKYLRLAADSADHALELSRRMGISGLNVTAPFKMDMARLLGRTGPASLNTLKMSRGRWRGVSTDEEGVIQALRRGGVEPRGRRAVVLGAGGAGFSAARALVRAGASTVLLNRDPCRARMISRLLGCEHGDLKQLAGRLKDASLLVSCLPRGVVPLRSEWLRPELAVLDAEYAAGSVAAMARERGCKVADGREWLLFQAAAGFHFLTGRAAPPAAVLRRALSAGHPARPNLALIGLSGSGKTVVGRRLAGKLGLDFFDLDAEIERRRGMSVADIFSVGGEAEFRRLERATLEEILRRKRALVACGGGVVLDGDNRRGLSRRCLVVWMWAEPEICAARLPADSRPLVRKSAPVASLRRQLRARRLLFADCADLVVDAATGDARQVAGRIRYEADFCALG